jgi:capsular exopolysaccharide synthesis family protein
MTEVRQSGQPVMDLREPLAVIRARRWTILLVVAVVLGAALILTLRQTPTYTARTQVLVEKPDLAIGSQAASQDPNMETERELAQSSVVASLAARSLGTTVSQKELLKHLKVDLITNTEILDFSYSSVSAEVAQRRAQAFANAYLEFRRESAIQNLEDAQRPLQQRIQDLDQQIADTSDQVAKTDDPTQKDALRQQVTALITSRALLQEQLNSLSPASALRVGEVVAPATLPTSPSSPKKVQNMALALLLGLALGITVAFLLERLDEHLRGTEDLEALAGAPVLAVVPKVLAWRNPRKEFLVTVAEPHAAASEAYRTLRVGVSFALAQRGGKVLMVTSANASEGKTTVTANLGVALANSGKRVVLISADLRKPRLHGFFAVADRPGLADVLAGDISVGEALLPSGVEDLLILSSGAVPGAHDALLGSDPMGRLLSRLREMADVVLIDCAPLLLVADALTLAPLADGVLYVCDSERTARGAVTRARRQLDQVNAEVIGCVLNDFDASRARKNAYYADYGYVHHEAKDREGPKEEAPSQVVVWAQRRSGS